jgi:hypothetical protein
MHQCLELVFQQVPFIGFRHRCLHMTAPEVLLGPLSGHSVKRQDGQEYAAQRPPK